MTECEHLELKKIGWKDKNWYQCKGCSGTFITGLTNNEIDYLKKLILIDLDKFTFLTTNERAWRSDLNKSLSRALLTAVTKRLI